MINWAEKERNLKYIATGHYARVRHINKNSKENSPESAHFNKHQLLRGLDLNKDQSYFLYDLNQEILEKTLFPLGELTKQETREAANKYKLRTANKPESQDLCLVETHGSMKGFLDKYLPPRQGEIVLKDGSVIGAHDGIEHFTIGQRKGIGVAWEEPLYVIEIQASLNRVVVGPRDQAGKLSCTIGAVNWVSIPAPKKSRIVEVQLRYRSRPIEAKLTPMQATDSDISSKRPYRCSLTFEKPQFSITPGQAAVFYDNEILLGGGLIQQENS